MLSFCKNDKKVYRAYQNKLFADLNIPEDVIEQANEDKKDFHQVEFILDDKGKIDPSSQYNVDLLMQLNGWKDRIRYDEFTRDIEIYINEKWMPIQDGHAAMIYTELVSKHRWNIKSDKVVKAIIKGYEAETKQKPFNSVTDSLEKLKWDGIPRMDQFFIKSC